MLSAGFKPNSALPRRGEPGYPQPMRPWIAAAGILGLCACAAPHATNVPGPTTDPRAQARSVAPPPFVSPYSYEQFLRGELALGRGDFEQAVAAFGRTLGSAEPDPYLRARYAEALFLAGHADEAMRALREGLEEHPGSALLLRSLGRLEARAGDLQAALARLEQAETLAPYDEEVCLTLAQVLRDADADERALSVLQRFAARVPAAKPLASRAEVRLALQAGDLERALHGTRDLLRHGPWPETAQLVEETASALLASGQALSAAELLMLLPDSEADLSLRLRALLAAQLRDKAADLLLGFPGERLGGFPAVPQAMLRVGLPARALDEADRVQLTAPAGSALAAQAQLIRAQALLALGQLREATTALRHMGAPASLPSLEKQRRQLLEGLLQAQAMPQLAAALANQSEPSPATP